MATGTMEVNGTTLYYEVEGSGHPLVLLHAGIADSRMWDQQFIAFSRHYRTIRYDRRGSGKSPLPTGEFYDAGDLLELLRLLQVDRLYCLGLSFGTVIALEFALDHPEMVDALILASPSSMGSPRSDVFKAKIEQVDEAAERGDLRQAAELEVQLWVDGPHRTPQQVDPVLRELVIQMNANNFALENSAATGRRHTPSVATQLGHIQIPTLILVGNEDQPHVLQDADIVYAGIPGSRKAVFASGGHLFNMEHPLEFNQAVLDFLESLAR